MLYIVWNRDLSVGFATNSYVLAYEIRKGAITNCYDENGTYNEFAVEFINSHDCDYFTLQEIEL